MVIGPAGRLVTRFAQDAVRPSAAAHTASPNTAGDGRYFMGSLQAVYSQLLGACRWPHSSTLSEPGGQSDVHSTCRHQVELRISNLAFRHRRALVGEVLRVGTEFPLPQAIATPESQHRVPRSERGVALVQVPAPDVGPFDPRDHALRRCEHGARGCEVSRGHFYPLPTELRRYPVELRQVAAEPGVMEAIGRTPADIVAGEQH